MGRGELLAVGIITLVVSIGSLILCRVASGSESRWEKNTWPELARLAKDVPEAGIHFQSKHPATPYLLLGTSDSLTQGFKTSITLNSPHNTFHESDEPC